MPQLIIGLDSLGDDANYIHIDDAKEDLDYYCPCCKGLIKPRAYKKNEDYQVQPHFYHVSGGCKEETFVHYICKEWLFVPGCKFIVDGVTYEVDSAETERTLHTSFGDYRPDIIVTTIFGKIFYFEIRVTNRKTELYAPKWDELGNDVVEVDTRYFINQKYNNGIPTFDLIYSEGKCYIKSYTRKDYDHLIGTRKVEWKRQNKLDYKIQWERLDWFWSALSEYKKDKSKKDSVVESFGAMDISDRIWCYQNVKGKSCVDIKKEFVISINKYYIDKVLNLSNKYDHIDVQIEHISPLIYVIVFRSHFEYLGYDLHDSIPYKVRSKSKILHPDLKYLEQQLDKFYQEYLMYVQKLSELKQLCQLDYIDSIVPISHKECLNNKIDSVSFRINYVENIHNKYVKEPIGQDICYICLITKRKIAKKFDSYKKSALLDLDYELLEEYIYNHSVFQKYIQDIDEHFNHYKINCWYDCINYYDSGFVILYGRYGHNGLDSQEVELCGPCSDNDDLSMIGQLAYNRSLKVLNNLNECMDKLRNLAYKINSCKNKLWTASIIENSLMIKLHSKGNQFISRRISIFLKDSIDDIICRVYAVMNEMASGLYGDIRLLEVNNSIE